MSQCVTVLIAAAMVLWATGAEAKEGDAAHQDTSVLSDCENKLNRWEYVNAELEDKSHAIVRLSTDQYFGQNSGRPVSDGAIVTKVLVIGAGFFQAMPLG